METVKNHPSKRKIVNQEIGYFTPENTFLHSGTIKNLSQTGLFLEHLNHDLNLDDKIIFKMNTGGINRNISAKIIWSNQFGSGVQFDTMDAIDQFSVQQYFDSINLEFKKYFYYSMIAFAFVGIVLTPRFFSNEVVITSGAQIQTISESMKIRDNAILRINTHGVATCNLITSSTEKEKCMGALSMATGMIQMAHEKRVAGLLQQ